MQRRTHRERANEREREGKQGNKKKAPCEVPRVKGRWADQLQKQHGCNECGLDLPLFSLSLYSLFAQEE